MLNKEQIPLVSVLFCYTFSRCFESPSLAIYQHLALPFHGAISMSTIVPASPLQRHTTPTTHQAPPCTCAEALFLRMAIVEPSFPELRPSPSRRAHASRAGALPPSPTPFSAPRSAQARRIRGCGSSTGPAPQRACSTAGRRSSAAPSSRPLSGSMYARLCVGVWSSFLRCPTCA